MKSLDLCALGIENVPMAFERSSKGLLPVEDAQLLSSAVCDMTQMLLILEDQILIESVYRPQRLIKPDGVMCRFAGDAFAVALRNCAGEQAAAVSGRMLSQLRDEIGVQGIPIDHCKHRGICCESEAVSGIQSGICPDFRVCLVFHDC